GCPKKSDPKPIPVVDAGHPIPVALVDAGPAPATTSPLPSTDQLAPADFEGEISVFIRQPNQGSPPLMKGILIRGSRVRFVADVVLSGAKTVGITDTLTQRTFWVDEAQRAYSLTVAPPAPEGWSVKKTGKMAKVADQACETWNLTGPDRTVE